MNQFEQWLNTKVNSPNSAYKYARAINSISNDMITANLLNQNLYNYTDNLALSFIIDKILNHDTFIKKNTIGHSMYSNALKYFIKYKNEYTNCSDIEFTAEDTAFLEGKEVLRKHIVRERNRSLIIKAKKLFKDNHSGRLFCEACGFDFAKVYGKLGDDFIEAHHIKPICEMKDGENTDINDIVMLCSNCHSMVHRKRPWVSKENLNSLLR